MRDAIDYAWSKNVLVVASAGNKGDSKERAPAPVPEGAGGCQYHPDRRPGDNSSTRAPGSSSRRQGTSDPFDGRGRRSQVRRRA